VLTFNYDCVVEKAAAAARRAIDVVRLGVDESADRPKLIKLHGSVNWRLTRQHQGYAPAVGEIVSVSHEGDFNFAISAKDGELTIASPGPFKRTYAESWLGHLWERAKAAAIEAETVTFIGYRFPPSDALARSSIVDWIGRNTQNHLGCNIVLGPNSPDAARLQEIVHVALFGREPLSPGETPDSNGRGKRYTLKTLPLWSQDFMSVYPEGLVNQPWRAVW
jgi:hypothetical protein